MFWQGEEGGGGSYLNTTLGALCSCSDFLMCLLVVCFYTDEGLK